MIIKNGENIFDSYIHRQSEQTFIHFKYERVQNKVNTFATIDTTVASLLAFVVVASSRFKNKYRIVAIVVQLHSYSLTFNSRKLLAFENCPCEKKHDSKMVFPLSLATINIRFYLTRCKILVKILAKLSTTKCLCSRSQDVFEYIVHRSLERCAYSSSK